MTVFFNKEAIDMITRNLVKNMYGIGGARQARRRALIWEDERRRHEKSRNDFPKNGSLENTSSDLNNASHQEA